ncbi:MAG: nicotinate (nicotinamide) nucleotide adenylyltransferase [Clostridiales bacterium]|nr:nicotinate (nicotinamide) nucleotide adenylyltransferase [Clostridiales bacterium]
MARIGILGGTFNPPHLAHIRLGEDFAKRLNFDKILILPNYLPPHKDDDCLADAYDRLNMCRLAIKDNPLFEVCDIEIKRKGKSYSYDTLKELTKLNPDDEFFFIIGSDMLFSFDKWYRYKDVLKMCRICAATREDEFSPEQLKKKAEELTDEPDRIIISKMDAVELSSTQVREKLSRNEDVSSLLNKDVLGYILQRGLYVGREND